MNQETCLSNVSTVNEIKEIFQLPIFYNDCKMELNKHILEDLELVETIDPSANSMYFHAFKPETIFGKEVIMKIPKYYTTDVEFLKENQRLLKSLKNNLNDDKDEEENFKKSCLTTLDIWDEIKNDNGFKERYHYLDWTMWEYLNESDFFLQIMSIYNLTAPIMSLLMPFVILIVPFFVIRMKGLQINLTEYYQILSVIISNHSIGKLFTSFRSVKLDEKCYLIISAGFYLFSIYQNFLACYRFYTNLKKIHKYLKEIELYLKKTEEKISYFIRAIETNGLTKFHPFSQQLELKGNVLREMRETLEKITPYKLSIRKIGEFGYVLQCFYKMYNNPRYNEAIIYSFGFHGYLELMKGLSQNDNLSFTQFVKEDEIVENKKKRKRSGKDGNFFKKMYYPTLIENKSAIKNSVNLNKNYIVTGPNASGKTTVLKTTLINIILSQQMGTGFYVSSNFTPFKYIHCYLNIPDTSGRDSLFQAEARRCKDILDITSKHPNDRHFCAFDELYSGTNPEEAVTSAYAFMKYLLKNKNVNCLLTTHFIKLCEKLEKEKRIVNMHMHTITKEGTNDFEYRYSMKKGISKIRGGIKVLIDMGYPKEILDVSRKEFI